MMNSVVFLMMKPLTVNFFILFVMTLKGGETKNYEFIIQGRKNHEMCSHRLTKVLDEGDEIVCLDSFSRIFLNSRPNWLLKMSTYSEVGKRESSKRCTRVIRNEIVLYQRDIQRGKMFLKVDVNEPLVFEYKNGFSDKDPPIRKHLLRMRVFFNAFGRYSFPFLEIHK